MKIKDLDLKNQTGYESHEQITDNWHRVNLNQHENSATFIKEVDSMELFIQIGFNAFADDVHIKDYKTNEHYTFELDPFDFDYFMREISIGKNRLIPTPKIIKEFNNKHEMMQEIKSLLSKKINNKFVLNEILNCFIGFTKESKKYSRVKEVT